MKTYQNGQVIRHKDNGKKTVYANKAVKPDFHFTYSI